MKFLINHCPIFLLISFVSIMGKISPENQNEKSLAFLSKYSGLDIQEGCVICKFVLQKVDKERDPTRECAEIAESEYLKEKQREWTPDIDMNFLSKWKTLYELQKKMMMEKGKPFKHEDDHYYYIIHPDHIKNYVVFENSTECNNSSCNETKKNSSNIITINITEEHNESIYIPLRPCGDKCKNNDSEKKNDSSSNNKSNFDNILERKTITFHDFDNTSPFPNDFIVSHEFQNVSNNNNSTDNGKENSRVGTLSALSRSNDNLIKNYFTPEVRFKTMEDNSTKKNISCNTMFKNHQEVSFHSEVKIPVNNLNNYYGHFFNQNNLFRKSNRKIIKDGPYQVDQNKLDNVFKRRGVENFRYNKNPSKENPITNPNPLPYDLDGNFIIDKNINNGNFAPTSFLIPEPHYNFFSSQANSQQNYPQFLEKSISKSSNPDNFQTNSYKFIEKKKDYNGFNDIEYSDLQGAKSARPGDNIFQILKGGKYKGYGKALLPPHPEDLYPESDCCYNFPCLDKPPCKNMLLFAKSNGQNKKNGVNYEPYLENSRFMEKKAEKKKEQEDNFLFIDPQQILYGELLSKNNAFIQIDEKNSTNTHKKRHCKISKNSTKTAGDKKRKTNIEKLNDSTFLYDKETNRRGRRKGGLPDPEWDCLERNIKDLIHFICEQEVSLSYMKYCKPLIDQMNQIIEGFLYHDSTHEICQNTHMCLAK